MARTDAAITPTASRDNAFGFLRLLFASLVIVSHTPEFVDGNRSRELLSRCFGSLSFGDLAVDGFFIVSGLLIPASYLASGSATDFLRRRVARIYPGFLVATAVALLVFSPAGGGAIAPVLAHPGLQLFHAALLLRPTTYGAFAGSHDPSLNGAMWSISYEFSCYLLTIGLGWLGVLSRPRVLATLAVVGVLLAVVRVPMLDGIGPGARLFALFLAGATARAARPPLVGRRAVCAAGLVAVCLFFRPLALAGVALGGTYLILFVALRARGTALARIGARTDPSYGIYLYAWPIGKLLIYHGMGGNLLLLGTTTWLAALACGLLSWTLVERPAMRLLRGPARPTSAAALPAGLLAAG